MSIILTCLILIAATYQDGISNRSRSDWSSLKVFVCMVSVFLTDKNFCKTFPQHGFREIWFKQNLKKNNAVLSGSDNKKVPKENCGFKLQKSNSRCSSLLDFVRKPAVEIVLWYVSPLSVIMNHPLRHLVLAWCISRQCVVDSLKEDVPPNPTVDSVDHDQAADPLYGVTPMWLEGGHQRGTFVSNFRGWLDPTPE